MTALAALTSIAGLGEIITNMKAKLGKANWFNIVFISTNALIGIVGAPLYIRHYGLHFSEIALFLFFTAATGLSITVGYHRLFAHATYKTNKFVQFLLLFFGAAAFEQSALAWSSQHRDHHQYVDTSKDPYNIKKGFFWAHMGWLIFGKHQFFYDNVPDLVQNKMLMHQARNYVAWGLIAGVATPIAIGALTGHLLGAFIISVCFRITFVYHATWCINSVCHMFGNRSYDIDASARDHWLVAILTFGEGYHNFHHRFPSDYRNGVRWYHWDPSKWIIAFLEKIGFAWNVKRVSNFRIIDARLAAENLRATRNLQNNTRLETRKKMSPSNALSELQDKYSHLRRGLLAWEEAATRESLDKISQARIQFEEKRSQWKDFIESDEVLLSSSSAN